MVSKEDRELIEMVSNSEFPLDAFLHDIEHHKHVKCTDGFDCVSAEEDVVKIAKTLEFYRNEARKWHDKCMEANMYKASAYKEVTNAMAKARAFEIVKKRLGLNIEGTCIANVPCLYVMAYRTKQLVGTSEEGILKEAFRNGIENGTE